MFDLSPIQIILVLVIALIALGPKRLPEMARSLGKGLSEFKSAMSLDGDDRRTSDTAPPAPRREEPPAPAAPAASAPAAPPATALEAQPAPPPESHDISDLIVPAARPTTPPPGDQS